ncbi:MAG TPA: gliding motility-associated ABC transporter substrate-binding protein GldG [Bacteroides sp.]|nr:gliding motility-associated ABC transporter substrate-binding protein GldG [Bacteroides sp.]
MKRKQLKRTHILQLITTLAIILLINYIGSFLFTRIDLTEEKRYSLAPETRQIIRDLDDVIYVRVYLDGELPMGFTRLKTAINELLDEFRAYAPRNIQYEFIDPSADPDSRIRNNVFTQLYEAGLQPTNAQVRQKDGSVSQKIVFPGAILTYREVEIPLNLLKNNHGLSGEVNLHQSIQALEYELVSMIRNLSSETIEKVAFLEGHGELDAYHVGDITKGLANFYQVDRGAINGRLGLLDPYSAVIIAKPVETFPEEDKFVIDQYIMNGGKVLWLIDPVMVSMDSLFMGNTVAYYESLNLEDQLFRYGIRLNPNLVKDIQCNVIPVNKGVLGGQDNWQLSPWFYYPILSPGNDHLITRALNMILINYGSVIDTVGEDSGVRKTVLLKTSPYSQQVPVPLYISLRETDARPAESEFNRSHLPLGVLLEGEFESVFSNRSVPKNVIGEPVGIREKSLPTKMIVVADGDIIRNEVTDSPDGPSIAPLGFDRFTNQTFGNREFLLNAINYLTDETGLMRLRGRELRLRMLDRKRTADEATKWKLINTIVPVLMVILFGILTWFERRRKYSRRVS